MSDSATVAITAISAVALVAIFIAGILLDRPLSLEVRRGAIRLLTRRGRRRRLAPNDRSQQPRLPALLTSGDRADQPTQE